MENIWYKPPIEVGIDLSEFGEWETEIFLHEKCFKPNTEFFVITKDGAEKRLGTIEDLIKFAQTKDAK